MNKNFLHGSRSRFLILVFIASIAAIVGGASAIIFALTRQPVASYIVSVCAIIGGFTAIGAGVIWIKNTIKK